MRSRERWVRSGAQCGRKDAEGNWDGEGASGSPALKRLVNGEAFSGALKRSFARPPNFWRTGAPSAMGEMELRRGDG